MKTFERVYVVGERFLPPLHHVVRKTLLDIAAVSPKITILDVGGRKSHYTIGVPARIIISDLPRETTVQKRLNLGITPALISQVSARRSNIQAFVFDDMTRSAFATASVDCVVAIEVLEHVEMDEVFVREVHRVLKPGGAFLLTTPNGETVRNVNPDHKRHYKRYQLRTLLESVFRTAEIDYAIKGGFFHKLGLRSWSLTRPVRTALSMAGAFANSIESSAGHIRFQPVGTQHLIALARK